MFRRAFAAAALAAAAGAAGWGLLPGAAHAVGGPCGPYRPGAGGVIQTFCNGPGKLTVTVGAKTYGMKGGECEISAGGASFNIGVVAPMAAAAPDYVGLTTPKPGPFSQAVLSARVGGKTYVVSNNTGSIGPKGGAFSGKAIGGEPVKGAFTC